MKPPKLFVLLALIVLPLMTNIAVATGGSTPTVSWTAPTTYTDNSALPGSDVLNYTISWSATSGGAVLGSFTTAAATTSATLSNICGTVFFSVTVKTTATAKYPNAVSAPSTSVSYTSGVACTPNPPTGVAAS